MDLDPAKDVPASIIGDRAMIAAFGVTSKLLRTMSGAECPTFYNAKGLRMFTRIGTVNSQKQIKAAVDATYRVKDTFMFIAGHVILVFSYNEEQHIRHVGTVYTMMK